MYPKHIRVDQLGKNEYLLKLKHQAPMRLKASDWKDICKYRVNEAFIAIEVGEQWYVGGADDISVTNEGLLVADLHWTTEEGVKEHLKNIGGKH